MATTPGELFLERIRPLLLPGVIVLAVLVLLLRARGVLQSSPRFVVDPSVCGVVSQPEWVSDALADSLARQVSRGLGAQASLLDGNDLRRWGETLVELSPWIEEVELIEPRFPHQTDVKLRLRRPVLAVEGEILVAASGLVLGPGPVDLYPAPLAYTGRELDEDVRECAAAAAEIEPFRGELASLGVRLVSVGIAAPTGTTNVETVFFRTDTDVDVNWGRTRRRSEFSQLDLPYTARIENLKQVLLEHPGLRGVRSLQVWTDRPVVVKRAG
jgi:hypothetical protein